QIDTAIAALKKTLFDALDEPTTSVFPLGEQNEPPIPPSVVGAKHFVHDPVKDLPDAGIGQIARGGADGKHPIHMSDRRLQIAELAFGLMGCDLDGVVVLQ